jgi:hypothetical protein
MRALLLLATTCVGLNGLQPPRAFQPVVSLCPGAASPVAPRVCLSRERGRRASSLSLRKTWGYGTKEFWDDMYRGEGELPADEYSWYCGWAVIQSFWEELVPDRTSRVLVPGVGNDATIADMWDAGWRSITAFDYSADAVVRAGALFGERQLELLCADARDLPLANSSFDAVFDKGALDAIGLNGTADLNAAGAELARVIRWWAVVGRGGPDAWQRVRLYVCMHSDAAADIIRAGPGG